MPGCCDRESGWHEDYITEEHDLGSYADRDEGDPRSLLDQTPHFIE